MFEGRKYGGGVIYEPTLVLREHMVWLGDGSRIDSFCKVEGGLGVHIRDGVHIASFSHINLGGGITIIENGAGISSGVRIVSGSNIPALGRSSSACDPSNVSERKITTLRENCIIFANAVVLPGVTIGRNSVVAAGAVVTKDVPDGQVWAGVPARFVGNVRLPDGRRPDVVDYAEYMRQIEMFQ